MFGCRSILFYDPDDTGGKDTREEYYQPIKAALFVLCNAEKLLECIECEEEKDKKEQIEKGIVQVQR